MQQQIITIAPLPVSEKKTRAAAYVRVSTNKDDQLNSFAAQYIHYKKLLEDSISEELVDVYADEGISGTTTKERDAFNKLISDCEQGKIDRIYTKSISRFARNTTECLKYVRYLKSLGVTIYFEKENLDTANEEMLLSGEMNTVVIDDCHYAAFELLDQEVEAMQTDIFDGNLIRMKTGGYEEPDFEMSM